MKPSSPIVSSVAALGSVLAATTCCLPIGVMWLAAGTASAGVFLDRFRPYLILLSVALIAFGFLQARWATSCSPARRRVNFVLLALSAFFVCASVLLPAWWTIGSHTPPQGQPPLAELASFDPVRDQWNASPRTTNLLVLLSPT